MDSKLGSVSWENLSEEQERYPLHHGPGKGRPPDAGGGRRAVMTLKGPLRASGVVYTAAFPAASESIRERWVSHGHSGAPQVGYHSRAQSCRAAFQSEG